MIFAECQLLGQMVWDSQKRRLVFKRSRIELLHEHIARYGTKYGGTGEAFCHIYGKSW